MTVSDEPTVVGALHALLADNPDAWIGAVDGTGHYTALPDELAADAHRRLRGRWALDHVAPTGRTALADAWRTRAELGVASARVPLRTTGTATFHVFDVAAELGADIIVAITDDAGDLEAAVDAPPPSIASRFCRIIRDGGGLMLEFDRATPAVLGITEEELLERRPPLERIHPDDHGAVLEAWMATLANETDGHRCRARVRQHDGSYRWLELTHFNHLDDPDRPHVVT
jgi:PAS domain S-box-containing protein